MVNPVKGEVPLVLADGREFVLLADHAGLVAAAQAYSGTTKINRLMKDMQPLLAEDGTLALDEDGDPAKDTMPATAAFFFGLLSAYHPQVTLREATNMLLAESDTVTAAIEAAITTGFPDVAEGRQQANPPPRPLPTPTGRRSGGSGAARG